MRPLAIAALSLLCVTGGHGDSGMRRWIGWTDPNGVSAMVLVGIAPEGGVSLDVRSTCGRVGLAVECAEMGDAVVTWWEAGCIAEGLELMARGAWWATRDCLTDSGPYRCGNLVEVGRAGEHVYLSTLRWCSIAAPPDGIVCREPVTAWMTWEVAELIAKYVREYRPESWRAWADETGCAGEAGE